MEEPQSPESKSMEDALVFEEIDVQRMHSVSFNGLALDSLSPEVNLVYGSNAAGKTTLAQALARALWPDAAQEARDRLEAQYRLNGDSWSVRVDAGMLDVRRNGREKSRHPLPPAELQDRYYLHLPELLRAEDAALAEEVLRQAAGGYDVDEAARQLGFEINTPTRRITEAQAVEEVRKELQTVRRDQEELKQKQRYREELKRQLEAAREAQRRVSLLEQAKDYAEAHELLREAEVEVDQFPDVLAEMRGDENQKLTDLRDDFDAAKAAVGEAREAIDEAESALSESRIPREEGLPEQHLRVLDARTRRLEHLDDRCRRLKGELASAEERAQHTWERIDGVVAEEQAANLTGTDMQEIATWARRAEQVRLKRKQLDVLEKLMGSDEPEQDPDRLREGYRLLARWLRSATTTETDEAPLKVVRQVAWGIGLTLIVGGIAIGLLVHAVGWGAVALGLVGLAFAEYRIRQVEPPADRSPETYRRDYEALDLNAPATWDAEAVARRLDALVEDFAGATLEAQKREALRQQSAQAGDLGAEEEELKKTREKLVRDLGLAPPLRSEADEAVLYAFVDAVLEWHKARSEVEARRAEHQTADEQAERTLDKINDALAPYELDADDADSARGAVQTLRDDVRDFEKHQEALDRAQDEKRGAQGRVQELDDEIEALLSELGADNHREVEELCEQYSDYASVEEQRRTAKTKVDIEQERLKGHPEFERELLHRSVAEIENELHEVQAQADQIEEIQKEINKIDTLVERAMDGRDLEKALADYERAKDALRAKRDEDEQRAIGRGLADFVLEETKSSEMPDVFNRARKLFATITNGQYQLDVDPQEGRFEARDTRGKRRYGLDKLSSGTRVQLLLAVRVAFIEKQEPAGTKLPVVFDETLANSDDRRARAMIEGIARLAQAGRQVFYLSAQVDEIAKWEEVLDEMSIPYERHLLGAAPQGYERAERPSVNLPDQRTDLPDPEEATREELARLLDVRTWHPRDHTGALHLWHLIEDPAVLVTSARAGIESWGQLQTLARNGASRAVDASDALLERCEALAEAVAAWSEAWAIGRGRPVDRAALEASGAVSDNFIDEVTETCEAVGGNAEELIAALRRGEVNRFRSNKTDELEEYFINEGYLDPQDPLSDDELWSRALARVADSIENGVITPDDVRAVLDRLTADHAVA